MKPEFIERLLMVYGHIFNKHYVYIDLSNIFHYADRNIDAFGM
jgi:hypothetical protein